MAVRHLTDPINSRHSQAAAFIFLYIYAISPVLSFLERPVKDLRGTVLSRYTSSGALFPSTTSLVIVQMPIVESDGISYMVSIIRDSMIEQSPLAPRLSLDCHVGDRHQRIIRELQLHAVQIEKRLILLDQCILRLS